MENGGPPATGFWVAFVRFRALLMFSRESRVHAPSFGAQILSPHEHEILVTARKLINQLAQLQQRDPINDAQVNQTGFLVDHAYNTELMSQSHR